MGEWTESSDDADKENAALPVKKKLKLSTSKQRSAERWHFVSEQPEEELCKKYVAKNTATSTKWALGNFRSWTKSRNERFAAVHLQEKQVPNNLLESTEDPATICKWLTLYITETRKDGTK